ncbi:MAG TPA: hypothetical protein VMR96_05055, partial [Solirubrobacterales bacterium]|nr:hypothetical protein [Solirubrobacterales bacterium]
MKRHVKASSAGSTSGQGSRPGFVRRAFATRGAFPGDNGSGASPGALRLALLAICTAAIFSAFVSSAAAVVEVTLIGDGDGTVTSDKGAPPINCSLAAGVVSGICSTTPPVDFSFEPTIMTAIPAPGSVFAGWTVGENDCIEANTPCNLLFPSFGSSYSLTAKFVPPPPLPETTTEGAAEVNYYYATLEGRVNPGGTKVDSCFLEYGETTTYGEVIPCLPPSIGSGSSDVAVSAKTRQLEPSTTYHYRLVATNIAGPGHGEDKTFTTAPAPADNCPNAAVRAEQGSRALMLPDCMAYEQVSPTKKFAALASTPVFSADGNRIYFASGAPLGDTPGLPASNHYISTRGPLGWGKPVATLPPKEYCCGGSGGDGSGQLFTPDLSHWANLPATTSEQGHGISQTFIEGIDGGSVALSPRVQGGIPTMADALNAAADLSHVFIRLKNTSPHILDAHLNSVGEPSLTPLAEDAVGKVWGGECGVEIGSTWFHNVSAGFANAYYLSQGAVSADGTRIYLTTRPTQPQSGPCNTANPKRILRRVETPAGPQFSEPILSECTRV